MRKIWLKKNEERRIKAGHLWVFSNEVDVDKSPLSDFEAGENANLCDCRGGSLGTVSVNPSSLICARLHSRQSNVLLDEKLLSERLEKALNLRKQYFSENWYRMCYSEGDFLPGLIVDLFGDHITVQLSTASMDKRKDIILNILKDLLSPKTILIDNDIVSRGLEGLSREVESIGELPEQICVRENNCKFYVPCANGQKTGWFYDQRNNRQKAAELANGKDVLDVFCYAGGFGVTSAYNNAKSVTFLDVSTQSLALAKNNACINAPKLADSDSIFTICGDAFRQLSELFDEGKRFSLINLDPPAFIKRKKDIAQGIAAYKKLNALAMQLLEPGGIFVSSSCSHHLKIDDLRSCIAQAAALRKLHPRVIYFGTQSIDHPMHISMPETAYLKCFICKIG